MKYLQLVDLTQNKITKLPQIAIPKLKKLVLDENEIGSSELKTNHSIQWLSLDKNKLVSLEGLQRMYELEYLSIQENEPLVSIKGLSNMPKLKKLVLKGNKIEKLDGLSDLPALEELYLDGNAIASLEEVEKIRRFRNLKTLNMGGCPISDEKGDDFKKEVIILLGDYLKQLRVINGDQLTPEEFADAQTEKENRIREAEGKPPVEEGAEGEEDA